MLRAVIFDMDGLLIDSEPLWVRAEMEVFRDVGIPLTAEDCERTKGLRVDDVVAFWHAHRPWGTPSLEDVERRLVARVAALLVAEGTPLPGVARALATARSAGHHIALASSSPATIIEAALTRLSLGDGTFAVVQSAETEPFGKPHPSVFIRTAERLGVRPVDCLVIEDSITGVIAAKAARMACLAVPAGHPHHDARFVLADAIVGSLEEVTPELVLRIGAIAGTRAHSPRAGAGVV